jgi:hypothetical protein
MTITTDRDCVWKKWRARLIPAYAYAELAIPVTAGISRLPFGATCIPRK